MVELIKENMTLVIISILAILALLVIAILVMAVKLSRIKGEEEKDQFLDKGEVALDLSSSENRKDEEDCDEEVVAAIIAAICAYSGMSAYEFSIRSIKIANSGNSEWRRQGLLP